MGTDMTKGRPLPVLLRFTIPLLLGNLFQQFYNMADTIIVGRYVGAGALAAVGSTGIIMFLITGFAQGLTSGFTILTAQRYGAGDTAGVKRSVSAGIFLSAVTTVVLTGFFLAVMDPLLRLMQTPEDIFREAGRYIRIIAAGTAVCVFYNLFSAFLRAVGNSRVPLFFLVFSACLNVALDLALIVGGGMGVEGAALATVLSQAVSAVLCGGYIFLKTPDLMPGAGQWRPHKGDVRRELSIGIPMALQFAITASGGMVMQSAVNQFGSLAVAAYTAAGKLETLVEQGMIALGQAMASYAGQKRGSGPGKKGSPGGHDRNSGLCGYGGSPGDCFPASGHEPVFCRRYKCHDAMGQDLHEHLCGVFYPVGCDLCIQERDAGMRIRLSAHGRGDRRAAGKAGDGGLCHENGKLRSYMLLPSGGMDGSGGVFVGLL